MKVVAGVSATNSTPIASLPSTAPLPAASSAAKSASIAAPSISISALARATAASASAPSTIANAIAAFKAAQAAGKLSTFAAQTISDASTALTSGTNLTDLANMALAGKIAGVTFTDSVAPTLTFDRSALPGDLSSSKNTNGDVLLLQKVNSKFVLSLNNVTATDALTIKAPTSKATLSLGIVDTAANIKSNVDKLETVAKSGQISNISVSDSNNGGVINVTATQATKDLDVLKNLPNTSQLTLTDTAANFSSNIAAIATLYNNSILGAITISDNKTIIVTEAQTNLFHHATNILTFSKNTTFAITGATADNFSRFASTEAYGANLTLVSVSATDTAVNFTNALDDIEAAGKLGIKIGFTLSDKNPVTVSSSKLATDIDAFKDISNPYTLNISNLDAQTTVGLSAPSKNATLSMAVTDTAANISANLDKLETLAKTKNLSSITISDINNPISLTDSQFKSDSDVIKLLQGTYSFNVSAVTAADVANLVKNSHVATVGIIDSSSNIIKNIPSLENLVTTGKITSLYFNDANPPFVSISNVRSFQSLGILNTGSVNNIGYSISDTSSNIIAHARNDVGSVIKNAKSVSISDSVVPTLTLADAKTLTSLTNLSAGTKYNIADGGSAIVAETKISNEIALADAANVQLVKTFSIADAISATGIKALDKGTHYSVSDTVANILTEKANKSDTILKNASTITIADTTPNVLANLDAIEALAKTGSIADIQLTDSSGQLLGVTPDQQTKDPEAIGKMVGVGLEDYFEITSTQNYDGYAVSGDNNGLWFNFPFPCLTSDGSAICGTKFAPNDGYNGALYINATITDIQTGTNTVLNTPAGFGPSPSWSLLGWETSIADTSSSPRSNGASVSGDGSLIIASIYGVDGGLFSALNIFKNGSYVTNLTQTVQQLGGGGNTAIVSENGAKVVTTDYTNNNFLFDANTGSITNLNFSPTTISGDGSTIGGVDNTTGQTIIYKNGVASTVTQNLQVTSGNVIALSNDGSTALLRDIHGSLAVYKNNIFTEIPDLAVTPNTGGGMSSDGSIVVGANSQGKLAFWQNGKTTVIGKNQLQGPIKMSADGSTIAWSELDPNSRLTENFIMRHGMVRQTSYQTVSISGNGREVLGQLNSSSYALQTLSA